MSLNACSDASRTSVVSQRIATNTPRTFSLPYAWPLLFVTGFE
jgi:hypothetical protein